MKSVKTVLAGLALVAFAVTGPLALAAGKKANVEAREQVPTGPIEENVTCRRPMADECGPR